MTSSTIELPSIHRYNSYLSHIFLSLCFLLSVVDMHACKIAKYSRKLCAWCRLKYYATIPKIFVLTPLGANEVQCPHNLAT